MKLVRWLLIAVVLFAGYRWWTQHHGGMSLLGASGTTAQFEAMPPLLGADGSAVLIYAPLNCPSAVAQRAQSLAGELRQRDIRYARVDEVSFDLDPDRQDLVASFKRVMDGGGPIVFVRGRAKANPSLDEVLAEVGGSGR